MTPKQYLQQARTIDGLIDSKLEQIARLRSLAQKTTTTLTDMPKGNGGNRVEYCVDRIIELEKDIDKDIDRFVDLKREIKGIIEQINDGRYRLILEYRYLNGMKLSRVADAMGYDYDWIKTLHGRALMIVGKYIPKEHTETHL